MMEMMFDLVALIICHDNVDVFRQNWLICEIALFFQVKLQKHNTEVHGIIKYRNGLHCAARIFENEGVWISVLQF